MKPLISTLLLMLGCGVCAAQQNAALSLSQYTGLALQNNRELRQVSLEEEAARQTKKSAFTNYFPKLSAAGVVNATNILPGMAENFPLLSMLGDKGTYSVAGLVVQQPVFVGGRVFNGNRLAGVGAEAASERLRMKRDEVRLAAEKKYRGLLVLYDKRKTLEAYSKMIDALNSQVEQAAQQGVATRTDVLRVNLKKAEINESSSALEKGIVIAGQDLRIFAGLPENDNIELAVSSEAVTEPSYSTASLRSRMPQRAEYRLLSSGVEAAKLQREMKTGEYLPAVSVGAMLGRLDALSGDFSGPQSTFQNSIGFAMVSIPLSDWWGGAHAISEMKLKEDSARERLAYASDYLVLDMRDKLQKYEQAYQRVQVARTGCEEADANKSEIEDGYNNGTEKLSDLLEAMALQQQNRDRLSEATADYFSARTAFNIAVGESSDAAAPAAK